MGTESEEAPKKRKSINCTLRNFRRNHDPNAGRLRRPIYYSEEEVTKIRKDMETLSGNFESSPGWTWTHPLLLELTVSRHP